MNDKNGTTIIVTRSFAYNAKTLFDVYTNYVAQRIMFASGILQQDEFESNLVSEDEKSLTLPL